jgi:Protein of unknown function (DUF3307)
MVDKAYLVLIVLGVLTTKHLFLDFFAQSLSSIKNKRIYGHPDGLLHAAGHAAGTCLAFLVITPSMAVGIGIIVAEFVLHYHIDWLKEVVGDSMELRQDQREYWWTFGIDQWLHQMTYLGIALVLIATG